MSEDPALRWAQRAAGLGALGGAAAGVFLVMAILSFSREDAWGTATYRGRELDAWPFFGGGVMLGVALAIAIAIFVSAYRLAASPKAGRGVFAVAAVLFLVLAAILTFASESLFGSEGSPPDRERAAGIGAVLATVAGALVAVAAALTTRVLRRSGA